MIDKYKKLINKLDKDIYNLSEELIKNVCSDLNKSDKADKLINKYLKNNKEQKKNNVKRPKTAYICFLEDVRPKIQKKYPNDKLGDISKRVGKLWQSLKLNDKEKYEKIAKKDVERFKKEMDISGIDNDIEKSHTLFNLEESNIKDKELLSSELNSSSGYSSSNSNRSKNSSEILNSDESSETFSDIDSSDEKNYEENSIKYKKK